MNTVHNMNVMIKTIALDFLEETIDGLPLPQEEAEYHVSFKAIERDFLELEDIKSLQQTHLSNALWQDGDLEKARNLQPQIEERQQHLECKTAELLHSVELYWVAFAEGFEEEEAEEDWDCYYDYEDDDCIPLKSYRDSLGDFKITITPTGFEEVDIVFDSPHSMGETGNHYDVGTLRGLGDKILEMCHSAQKDMGRMLTFTAHPTSVGRERIYKLIVLKAGCKIINGRQSVGKNEKKHERGESFSFVL